MERAPKQGSESAFWLSWPLFSEIEMSDSKSALERESTYKNECATIVLIVSECNQCCSLLTSRKSLLSYEREMLVNKAEVK